MAEEKGYNFKTIISNDFFNAMSCLSLDDSDTTRLKLHFSELHHVSSGTNLAL